MKYLLACCLLLNAVTGNGQKILTPGAGAFEKKWLKNDSATMIWYRIVADTSTVEIGTIHTRTFIDQDKITLITKVNLKNAKGPWIDSTVEELNTLRPVRHSSFNPQRDMVLNFGRIINGYYTDKMKGTTTVIKDSTCTDYFDSNLYPALIAWLPLKNGYQQEIYIYDFNPASKSGVLKATVNNVHDTIYQSIQPGKHNVWAVSVSDEISNGSTVYYIDKADRKLWKQVMDFKGVKFLIERKE